MPCCTEFKRRQLNIYTHNYRYVHGLIHIYFLALFGGRVSKQWHPNRNKLSTVQILVSKCHWKPYFNQSNLWKDADSRSGAGNIEDEHEATFLLSGQKVWRCSKVKRRVQVKDIKSQPDIIPNSQAGRIVYITQSTKEISMNAYW